MGDPRESYQSPLNSRYASVEMKYNFSEKKKFSEWRKLWVILAKAQKELGVQHDGRDIADEQGGNSIEKFSFTISLKNRLIFGLRFLKENQK